MKQTTQLWLFTFVTLFSLAVGSCKDDDNKTSSEQEKGQQAEKDLGQAVEFWNVVGQLTDDVMPDDWQSATYAPSIGHPDGANTTVRIVACADEENAAQRFADLVGLTVGNGFSATTTDYTYHNDNVGTLRYQKTSGSSLAIVDVDIRQMPGLSQIIFKSPEKMQENGAFNGTAYYRFGDVVMKLNADQQWDYWICVRPCFGPESKGDSHWMSLSKLPSANVKTTSKNVNGVKLSHIMPKSLCANQTHMQNLAELLYAMTSPDTWAGNLSTNYAKLKYFYDFHYATNYKFNNQYFFENVGNRWPEGLYQQIFGLTKEELAEELNTNGLNLIYSSATMSGNDITLPVVSFTGTNLKTKTLSKQTSTWTTESFNIYDLTKKGYAEFAKPNGGNKKAWVARYATGATLAKGSAESPTFDKYKRLPNCRDLFVYNIEVDNLKLDNLPNIPPKEAVAIDDGYVATKAHDDSGTYMVGDVVADEADNRWICIAGAPWAPVNDRVTDRTATFISFDFNDANIYGSRVQGLPTEEEALEAARLLMKFLISLQSLQNNAQYAYVAGTKGRMGDVVRHILTYADVDIRKTHVAVDSVWTFSSGGGEWSSKSTSFIMNFAYNDDAFMRQAVMRLVYDFTQAGSERNKCSAPSGKTYADWLFRYYWHYEDVRLPRMREATADERYLGMNEWCLPWRMTTDKMYLQDVEDQDMVNKYAANDKWSTLPLATGDANTVNPRRTPRTTAEGVVSPSDYIGKYDTYDVQKTNIFNEPVMFFRVMRVTDNGGRHPNLVAQDGRRLHVVHLQNNADLYNGYSQAIWAHIYNQGAADANFVDNVVTPMPLTPGWRNP